MRKWYPWILVGIAFGFSAAMYSRLPDPIPTHWNLRGEVDGYTPRAWGAWLMPAVVLAMVIILPWLPRIDPRRVNFEKFQSTYDLMIAAVTTLIVLLHVAMLGAGAGWPIRIERVTPFLIGALFILLGNVMPRARPNWFFGVRTPWTLSNDRVWERTHRVTGFTFVIAGLILMATAFLRPSIALPLFIGAIVIASIVPLAYSYLAWRQETSRATNS